MRMYLYLLKSDTETFSVLYNSDDGAKYGLLDIYGDNLRLIWRPGKTVFDSELDSKASKS